MVVSPVPGRASSATSSGARGRGRCASARRGDGGAWGWSGSDGWVREGHWLVRSWWVNGLMVDYDGSWLMKLVNTIILNHHDGSWLMMVENNGLIMVDINNGQSRNHSRGWLITVFNGQHPTSNNITRSDGRKKQQHLKWYLRVSCHPKCEIRV